MVLGEITNRRWPAATAGRPPRGKAARKDARAPKSMAAAMRGKDVAGPGTRASDAADMAKKTLSKKHRDCPNYLTKLQVCFPVI